MFVKSARYENLDALHHELEMQERDIKSRESFVESQFAKIRDRERALQLPEAELESKIQQRINRALELNNNIYRNKAELLDKVSAERDRLRDEVNEYYAIASELEIGQGVSLQKVIDTVHSSRTQNAVQKVLDVVEYLRTGYHNFAQEIIDLANKANHSISRHIHRGR